MIYIFLLGVAKYIIINQIVKDKYEGGEMGPGTSIIQVLKFTYVYMFLPTSLL